MNESYMVCTEHTPIHLFVMGLCIGSALFILLLIKGVPVEKASDQFIKMGLVMVAIVLIGIGVYMFLRYSHKRLSISSKQVVCVNSIGQQKVYRVDQVKGIKIIRSARFDAICFEFQDGYRYKMNGSAKGFSQVKTLAEKMWTDQIVYR